MNVTARLVVEFIGTFFLCLAIALNANAGEMNMVAITGVLIGVIYAGGHVSNAHYNPAVTVAFYLRGYIRKRLAYLYWLVQIAAALAAAGLAKTVFATSGDGGSAVSELGSTAAVVGEFLGTFALAFVILNVAIAKNTIGNGFYGLAIGMTVLGCGYLFAKYSGAAFNPAVAVSQSIAGFFSWSDLWIYLLGNFSGGVAAAILFGVANPED